ncbi:MAG: T9SS type A sorting domain-containing protein [Bacteroidales bacterium]|nr:T9SS type A sorting domain-containing protein [Bacteroidales bacterium]
MTALSPYGCGDATHDLGLTIHPLQNTEFEAVSCGPLFWNGTLYEESGDYEQVLQSIYGCDSTVVMHLEMVDAYNVVIEEDACDEFVWNGVTYDESGIYTNTFTSAHGCDSIVTMHLNMHYSVVYGVSAGGCDSFEYEGVTYTESGDYILGTYQTQYGCDSISKLSLTITNTPMVKVIEGNNLLDVAYTPTSTYTIDENLPDLLYIWGIEPEEAGTIEAENASATVVWGENYKGEAVVKVSTSNVCGDALSELHVTVKNSTGVDENGVNAKIYPNPTSDLLHIEVEGLQRLTVSNVLGQIVYDTEVDADEHLLNMQPFGAGIYLIRLYTTNGIGTKRVTVTQ